MLNWLTKHFRRPKVEYQTSKKHIRKRLLDVQKPTIGRPKLDPTEALTLKLPIGLKAEFRALCKSRNVTISYAIAGLMKQTLAESSIIDYKTFISSRLKPKSKSRS